jgi:hypothetical protein
MDIFWQTNHKRLMVVILGTILGFVLAGCTGLSPQFTYQGVLTDSSGNPIDGDVTITYRIFNQASGGTSMYTENESITLTDGRFDSVVGPQTAVSGLAPEDLAQPLWIEIQVGNGTYTETLTPRQQLYGAPYAFTLMPSAVISGTMGGALFSGGVVNAITTVRNEYPNVEPDDQALPALRLIGDVPLELVDRAGGTMGSIYTERANPDSDFLIRSNDQIRLFLDSDNTDSDGNLRVFNGSGNEICVIDESGNLTCDGAKSATVQIADQERLLYAVESPEVWFEDISSGTLVSGKVAVTIDPLFAESINLNEAYHVFLTPLGDCNGLYVTNKTATGFDVVELGGGTSNVNFDYRIVAKRVGYEGVRMELAPMSVDGEDE